jgi:hypothetical protein
MNTRIANTNDGTQASPRLRIDLHMGTFDGLPEWSAAPRGSAREVAEALVAAGFEGVQAENKEEFRSGPYREVGLSMTTAGRANTPEEINAMAAAAADAGYDCVTTHIAWGYEEDAEVDQLVGAVIEASGRHSIPIYIETHRATITQDPWRTIQMVARNPGVRFNGDFSHWYTGTEMIYGDVEAKLDLMAPVFDRVRFMHARVGNTGHVQVPLADPSMETAMGHFREIWTRSFQGFLRSAAPGDYLVFAPELLPAPINYARLYRNDAGEWVEDSDRWEEALELVRVAQECFAEAERREGLAVAGTT